MPMRKSLSFERLRKAAQVRSGARDAHKFQFEIYIGACAGIDLTRRDLVGRTFSVKVSRQAKIAMTHGAVPDEEGIVRWDEVLGLGVTLYASKKGGQLFSEKAFRLVVLANPDGKRHKRHTEIASFEINLAAFASLDPAERITDEQLPLLPKATHAQWPELGLSIRAVFLRDADAASENSLGPEGFTPAAGGAAGEQDLSGFEQDVHAAPPPRADPAGPFDDEPAVDQPDDVLSRAEALFASAGAFGKRSAERPAEVDDSSPPAKPQSPTRVQAETLWTRSPTAEDPPKGIFSVNRVDDGDAAQDAHGSGSALMLGRTPKGYAKEGTAGATGGAAASPASPGTPGKLSSRWPPPAAADDDASADTSDEDTDGGNPWASAAGGLRSTPAAPALAPSASPISRPESAEKSAEIDGLRAELSSAQSRIAELRVRLDAAEGSLRAQRDMADELRREVKEATAARAHGGGVEAARADAKAAEAAKEAAVSALKEAGAQSQAQVPSPPRPTPPKLTFFTRGSDLGLLVRRRSSTRRRSAGSSRWPRR